MEKAWQLVERYVPTVGGLEREVVLVGVLVLAAFVWLAIRKRNPRRESLQAAYRKIENAEIKQWQRPYALLATRDGWDELPQYFLMELASRLEDKDNVIEFINLAESQKLERGPIPKLAQNDAGTACRGVSVMLTDLARRLGRRDAERALSMATLIDPANPRAVYGLAQGRYKAKRYGEAMPLFEQAILLCEAVIEGSQRLDVRSLQREAEAKESERREDIGTIFERAQELYEDCRARV